MLRFPPGRHEEITTARGVESVDYLLRPETVAICFYCRSAGDPRAVGEPTPVGSKRILAAGKSKWAVHGRALAAPARPVELSLGCFPMASVELLYREGERLVDAMGIDAPRLRMRAWLIEAFHATLGAEQVLRDPCTEAIASQWGPVSQEREMRMRHDDVQKSRHAAD